MHEGAEVELDAERKEKLRRELENAFETAEQPASEEVVEGSHDVTNPEVPEEVGVAPVEGDLAQT